MRFALYYYILVKMNDSNTYLTISECADRFKSVTESSLRRWIKSGKIPQSALLITESTHKAGRMVTQINVSELSKIIQTKTRTTKATETVPFDGTNQVAGNWEQMKRPFEDFIAYLKEEVESQRLRAEMAEERAQKAENDLRQLTHHQPSEGKVKGKESESKKMKASDVFMYVMVGLVAVVLILLLMQELKYKI